MKNGGLHVGRENGGNVDFVPFRLDDCLLPRELLDRLGQFLLDKRTGNMQFNIKDGQILGAQVTEFHSIPSRR